MKLHRPTAGGPAAVVTAALQLVLALGISPAVVAQQTVEDDAVQRFSVDVNLVTLRFTVRDAAGRFINDLGADDFQVLENGSPREVTFFEEPSGTGGDAGALWLAFLIDVSGSTFATRAEEILAAQSFFDNIHAVTRVGIFGFTDALIPFYEFSPDKRAALAAFSSARAHLGKTALYAALDSLVGRMAQLAGPSQEKAVIIVSDGMDDQYARAAASASLARRHNVRLYTVWVPSAAQLAIRPSLNSDTPETLTPEQAQLEASRRAQQQAYAQLSGSTGGRHFGGFETILNFDDVLAEINDEVFGNLYALAYRTPAPTLDRTERNVEIAVRRPGAQIHGLFHKVPERVRAKKTLIEALFNNSALSTLSRPSVAFREIGAQLDLLSLRREGDRIRQPFRIKISPHRLQVDRETGGLRTQFGIVGLLSDPSGQPVVRLREVFRASLDDEGRESGRSIVYTNTLAAPPGQYSLRLAVVEIPTWRITLFDRTLRLQ